MAQKQSFESCNHSYTDGIKVKISEHYKPPHKINPITTYTQRILQNEQIHKNIPRYDFTLEIKVKEKMKELRDARQQIRKDKKTRLEIAKEKRDKECNTSNIPSNIETYFSPDYHPTYSRILTPIPLNEVSTDSKSKICDKSPLNISDFEADNSSPFDNVELKTINDLEELAQVLRINEQNYVQYYAPSTSYSAPNGYRPLQIDNNDSTTTTTNINKTTIPDIMKALHSELKNAKEINKIYDKTEREEDEEEEGEEMEECRKLLEKVTSMGFPKNRVRRACKSLGNDEKKVVEYLLAMTQLLDLGFNESDVCKALLDSNSDRDKALELLLLTS